MSSNKTITKKTVSLRKGINFIALCGVIYRPNDVCMYKYIFTVIIVGWVIKQVTRLHGLGKSTVPTPGV